MQADRAVQRETYPLPPTVTVAPEPQWLTAAELYDLMPSAQGLLSNDPEGAAAFAELMPDASHVLSEEPRMETSWHESQLRLLVNLLEWHWRDRNDYFVGANLTVFYSQQMLKTRDFRGPDFFVVLGTEKRPRTSWVVWEEDGLAPHFVLELLSPKTWDVDRKLKRQLYAQRLHAQEYFWFSPVTKEFIGLTLNGDEYIEIAPNDKGWRWSQKLQYFLGVHEGKLRFFDADGNLLLTSEEDALAAFQREDALNQRANAEAKRAKAEAKRANAEAKRADAAAQLAEQLAAKLRALGIDPNQP